MVESRSYFWEDEINHHEHGEVTATVIIHNSGDGPFEVRLSEEYDKNLWEIVDSQKYPSLDNVESFLGIDLEFGPLP